MVAGFVLLVVFLVLAGLAILIEAHAPDEDEPRVKTCYSCRHCRGRGDPECQTCSAVNDRYFSNWEARF